MALERRSTREATMRFGRITILASALGYFVAFLCIGGPSQAQTWTPANSMPTERAEHTATLLPDGRVLVTGGFNQQYIAEGPDSQPASALLYDPATGSWVQTGSMDSGRILHTATLLQDGRVLIAGGALRLDPGTSNVILSSAEVYDPATGTFTPTGSMNTPRHNHIAVLLPDGKVLIAGGSGEGDALASAELYDPSTGAFTLTGSMSLVRHVGGAVLLPDGTVLYAGGNINTSPTATATLYHPDTGMWTDTGSMVVTKFGTPSPTLLGNGQVLIQGGFGAVESMNLASAELYDPTTGTFRLTGAMANRRNGALTATRLDDGRVLVAGGPGASAEIYDSATENWLAVGSMCSSRQSHTATLLPNGLVLVVGGNTPSSVVLASAELFDRSNPSPGANAGPDQSALEGATVTLSGAAGCDPGGNALILAWSQIAGPAVFLDVTDLRHPTFQAPLVPANATLTFEFSVDNGLAISRDTVDVTVKNVNNPPIADAGDDATIKEGAVGTLNGSFSFDPEGDAITFEWTQVAGPSVTLSPSNLVASPTFVAPMAAGSTLVFKLRVSDGRESSMLSAGQACGVAGDDTVCRAIVANSAPVANAGPDQTKDEGESVSLDGSASHDPDGGDTISFQWTQVAGPPVLLSNAATAMPTFTAPLVASLTALEFELVVTDDDPANPKNSPPDRVTVNVRSINDPPSCHLAVANPASLWPPNHKMVQVAIDGVHDGDAVFNTVTIEITGVTQDEPVNGLGDGDSSPDAVIQDGAVVDTVLIRAERSGTGNGRVYEVTFDATDGFESCTSAVNVQVPHSRKDTAIDDGQPFESTLP